MIRRGQHKKRELRKALRQAERELESGRGKYEPPNRDECVQNDWYFYADENETVRVHTYTWHLDGRLADFAIILTVPGAYEDEEVERIDCAHGHCHHHRRNGSCHGLVKLETINDVQPAFDATESLTGDRVRILLEREEP